MSQTPSPFSQTPAQATGPAPVFAPPTQPGALPTSPAVWPQVVGIASIVIGGLGVLTNCFGVASAVLMSSIQKFIPSPTSASSTTVTDANGTTTTVTIDPTQGMQAAMGKWQPWIGAGAVLQLLAAALLVGAGIFTLKRARLGVQLHVGYAAFRTVTVLFYNIVNMLYMQDLMAGMSSMAGSQAGGPPPAVMSGMMSAFGMIGVVVGIVWGLAYPAFLLIWFNLGSTRRETAGWK